MTQADAGPNGNRAQAERLAQIINRLPTLDEDDLEDRWAAKFPNAAQWKDEGPGKRNLRPKYEPEAHITPGFGETRDDPECGAEIPHVCEEHGHPIEVGRTCRQSECPRCAPMWVVDRAYTKASRIISAAKMKDGAQYKHHVAVGLPPGLLVDLDRSQYETVWKAIIKVLQRFCKEIDFDGIIVPHAWRGADEDGDLQDHEDDRGEWKKRLFNGRNWHGDVREELEFSPHVHLIGACPWFPGGEVTKLIYQRTGWIFERITGLHEGDSSISLGDMDSVARAATYAISHGCIDTRGERNRWVYGTVGSAYHNADDRHHEEARRAVQKIAPKTLGVPSMEVECRHDVPADEADHDELEEYLDDAGDGDDSSSSSDSDPSKVKCRGGLAPLNEEETQEMIEDPAWQRSAWRAHDAMLVLLEWRRQGGWQGWVEREQLTIDDVLDDVDDRPPPD